MIKYNHSLNIGSKSIENLSLEPLPEFLIFTSGVEFNYSQYNHYLVPQLEEGMKEFIVNPECRRVMGHIPPDYNQPNPCLNTVQLFVTDGCLYMIANFRAMNSLGYENDPIYLSHLYMSLLKQSTLGVGGITMNVGIFYE